MPDQVKRKEPAVKNHRHCEAVRPHPRVASLALRAIHLLAIRSLLSPEGTGGALHRWGCGLPRRYAARNDRGGRGPVRLSGSGSDLGRSAGAVPPALREVFCTIVLAKPLTGMIY